MNNTAQEETYGYNADDEILIRVRAMEALRQMRAYAESKGWMSDEEIEAEIAAARRERHEREKNKSRD